MATTSTKSRYYGGFRGVDFTSDPSQVSQDRFSEILNMWKDYESRNGLAIETFPGFRSILPENQQSIGHIYGIHPFGNLLIVHAGKNLYSLDIFAGNGTTITQIGASDVLAAANSISYVAGDNMFLMDGVNTYRIGKTNNTLVLDAFPFANTYIPLTYIDGGPYEQRNILNNFVRHKYTIQEFKTPTSDDDESSYTLLDPPDIAVEVTGSASFSDSFLTISTVGNSFPVVSILENAYKENSTIYAVRIKITCDNYNIGSGAFQGCENLEFVIIDNRNDYANVVIAPTAFSDCPKLKNVIVIGNGITKPAHLASIMLDHVAVGTRDYSIAFIPFTEYQKLQYVSSTAEIISMSEPETINSAQKTDEFAVYEWENGESIYVPVSDGILLFAETPDDVVGKTLEIKGAYFESGSSPYNGIYPCTYTSDNLKKCTIVVKYDGRVFLSGSPDCPNVVFYCGLNAQTGEMDPTFFGEYQYFRVGTAANPVVSMIATSSALMVLKNSSAQEPSVYYYTGVDNSATDNSANVLPRFYVAQEGVPGIGCEGAACNFLDDVVFVSRRGLDAIGKQQVNLERSIVHRSSLVDARLLNETLSDAILAEWKGYLCILFPNGHMYLADSRKSFNGNEGAEYEFFYADGMCGYVDQTNAYVYAQDKISIESITVDGIPHDLELKPDIEPDAIVTALVMSFTVGEGASAVNVRYTLEDGHYYLVDWFGEKTGGLKSNLTSATVFDDRLIFGTEGGDIFCVNTDKRGADHLIPRQWYTQNGRRYLSGFATKSDNCSVPHLRKKMIKKSLVCKMKAIMGSAFNLQIRTDREPYRESGTHTNGILDFVDFDFNVLDFNAGDSTIVPYRASAKKFVEIQFRMYSDSFDRPFGVYEMAYRFEMMGRVKEV